MKRKTGNKEEKRTRIGIVTNMMSNEVYQLLQQKAKQNELSKYIIHLVEMDIQKDLLKEQFTYTHKKLEEFNDSIMKMEYHLEELKKVYGNNMPS